jgi:ubiquinone/menaquinone biosynthesis C-methylase UbiE
MDSINTLTIVHKCLREEVKPGHFCIDATAGNGYDTALLCELTGPSGKVIAFDIQQSAIERTRERLENAGLGGIGEVILDSHANMEKYAAPESADIIVFNFGYLPGGDKTIFTQGESSCEAIRAALRLLKTGGLMCLSLYYGGPNGYGERDAILLMLRALDPKECTVIMCDFLNRGGDPPFPIFIKKGSY